MPEESEAPIPPQDGSSDGPPAIATAILLVLHNNGDPVEINTNPRISNHKARVPNIMETYRILAEATARVGAEINAAQNAAKITQMLAAANGGLVGRNGAPLSLKPR